MIQTAVLSVLLAIFQVQLFFLLLFLSEIFVLGCFLPCCFFVCVPLDDWGAVYDYVGLVWLLVYANCLVVFSSVDGRSGNYVVMLFSLSVS